MINNTEKKFNINDLTLEEKIGQMLMFAFHGQEFNDEILIRIKEFHVGGLIYFGHNIKDCEQVKKLNKDIQKEAKIPLFIGVDEEGGTVQRIIEGITPFPGAMAVSASSMSPYELCKSVAHDLRNIGFNMNFAPVGDVNCNAKNPVINSRSFSDDPNVVSHYVIESFKGFQDGGILPTCKHYPGHGDTSVDSHVSLPTVNKTYEELINMEFVPFKKAIDNGIDGIMASHILYPSIDDKFPATLSKKIITGELKQKMGFEGIIVTDSLTMGAINQNFSVKEIVNLATNAGIDLMIFCGKADINEQREVYLSLLEEVNNGNIPMSRIDESVTKILKLKEKYINNFEKTQMSMNLNKELIGRTISEKSITHLLNDISIDQNDKVLVLSPKMRLLTLVDNQNPQKGQYLSLGLVLKENLTNYVEEIMIEDSETNEFEKLLQDIQIVKNNFDKIIFQTINVTQGDYFTRIWNSFNDLDKEKIILISLRSPYDVNYLDGVKSYICLYEPSRLAFESLSKCIKENKFYGKLPVKLNNK